MKTLITVFSLCFLVSIANVYAQNIQFTKVVIDPTFVSAGVTAADIDKDGLTDIVAGDVWYKAPDWTRYEIRPLGNYYGTLVIPTQPRGSGASYYSSSIGNYTQDIDGDGWLDVIVFNSQGAPCYWYRNPQGKFDQLWEEYLAIEIFHNESPQLVDLFEDGSPVVLAGHHIGEEKYSLSWFSIPKDPTQLWEPHIIGHPDHFDYAIHVRWNGKTQRYAPGGRGHGLGIGDVDGDGITDVLTSQGWYKGPKQAKATENWAFHPLTLKNAEEGEQQEFSFAQIFVDDFDRDGDADFIGGAAHNYGLWWFEQVQENGAIQFIQHEIAMNYSQLHALISADFDGDGIQEYVTGKRYLAHLGKDPGSSDGAVLVGVSHKNSSSGKPTVQPFTIDTNSGSGTQIWVADINKDGKPDIITSNKKGTHLFLQQ